MWDTMAENTVEYCHKGDLIGIKGRLQALITETDDGTKNKVIEVIAERVTFLSNKKEGD